MRITVQKKNEFVVIAKSYLDNVSKDPYIKEQIKLKGYDDKRLDSVIPECLPHRFERETAIA